MKSINIGLLGFGTVGQGVFKLLNLNKHEIKRRIGLDIKITHIAVRNLKKNINILSNNINITENFSQVTDDKSIDIIIELIGGIKKAKELILRSIENKKHVVTANKELIAIHGKEIFKKARLNNIIIAFEASVAGGIPIIKILREGLSANHIQYIVGIINGTTNYILSEMYKNNISFSDALNNAQKLGYAEKNPYLDINGTDSAYKLCILSAIAFGTKIQFDKIYIKGIESIDIYDIKYAKKIGYKIKLLGITCYTKKGIELRVHPCLIKNKTLLSNINGVMNAIIVSGNYVGTTLYCGIGAGSKATASSVISDVIDIIRFSFNKTKYRIPYLSFQINSLLSNTSICNIKYLIHEYYLRLRFCYKNKILSEIIDILKNLNISIKYKYIQQIKNTNYKKKIDLILITKKISNKIINLAISKIKLLKINFSKIKKIRIEKIIK